MVAISNFCNNLFGLSTNDMITTAIIYIISFMISIIAFFFPDFQLWPVGALNAFDWFIQKLIDLASMVFFLQVGIEPVLFFLQFLGYFGLYLIVIKLINWGRGVGKI